MNELLIAALAGSAVWFLMAALRRRDPAVAAGVAALARHPAPPGPRRSVGTVLAALGRRTGAAPNRVHRELLDSAGFDALPSEAVRGAQVALGGLGFSSGLLLGPLALVICPLACFIGYRLPLTALALRTRRRREETASGLSDVVDLLVVCSHAGLNLDLSLRRVARRASGVMGTEIRRVMEEVDLGVPRSQALQNLATRNPLPELEALVKVLANAERFGSQVASSLEAFSADLRGRRRRRAEEQARRAPVKILFPLVFLILPAFVLLTVLPLLVSAFESMSL